MRTNGEENENQNKFFKVTVYNLKKYLLPLCQNSLVGGLSSKTDKQNEMLIQET